MPAKPCPEDGPNSRVTLMNSASKFRACVCANKHVFVLWYPTEIVSFSIRLVCPSLGVKQDSLVGECLKPGSAYIQCLGNSLGNQHTHTQFGLSLLPQKCHPERLLFQSFTSSPRLKTDSALSSGSRSKLSQFSDSHPAASRVSGPPGSLHLNRRHCDPEPHNVQIPAGSHSQILLLQITPFRLK